MIPRSALSLAPSLALVLCMPMAAEVRDLKAFYQERCAVCHGTDGSGRGANGGRLGGPSLTGPRGAGQQEEAEWVTTLLKGKGAMPGYRRQLSEIEARRMVALVTHPMTARKKR